MARSSKWSVEQGLADLLGILHTPARHDSVSPCVTRTASRDELTAMSAPRAITGRPALRAWVKPAPIAPEPEEAPYSVRAYGGKWWIMYVCGGRWRRVNDLPGYATKAFAEARMQILQRGTKRAAQEGGRANTK